MPDNTNILIIGVNWLGDSVMAMSALQSYHRRHPEYRLTMLTREPLAPLWRLHPALTAVRVCSGALPDILRTARDLRYEKFQAAYIWPRSFRSALLPWLMRIPRRYGLPGHSRDWMLTDIVQMAQKRHFKGNSDRRLTTGSPSIIRSSTQLEGEPVVSRLLPVFDPACGQHQAFEYLRLMGCDDRQIDPPRLNIPLEIRIPWQERLEKAMVQKTQKIVALMPGAAFGPAKRWPAENFVEIGRQLQGILNAEILVLGAPAEYDLCRNVADKIGEGALNLAGQTTLTDLAAILSQCALAITNDSGGMHLAAATGCPLIAIFGVTDPAKTGPLGERAIVLQDSDIRARDFKKHIHDAAKTLARITPARVIEQARQLL